MREVQPGRVHLITGGYPAGALAGHDMDYARIRLLELLEERGVQATVGNDFTDIHRWLPGTALMLTYTAGPHLDGDQNKLVRWWMEDGGRWVGLHGTSGGRAKRVDGETRRRMIKSEHHDTLGSFFISHPQTRRFRVDVSGPDNPLTRGLPSSFMTIDEPYMVEIQHPNETDVVLSSELGPDHSGYGFVYDEDTSLQADGKTRVMGYTRDIGKGGVAYVALGHCHSPASQTNHAYDETVEAPASMPAAFRASWDVEEYVQILRNGIDWGVG